MTRHRPTAPPEQLLTLLTLRDWMVAEGANFGSYALDGRGIGEG